MNDMPDQPKSSDDVQQLLRDLSIGGLQYREFAKPNAAHLRLAPNRPAVEAPAASPPSSAPPLQTPPLASLPQPAAAPPLPGTEVGPAPARRPAATPRAVHESPLNFTFERLRRQAIASRATPLQLDLKLPSRRRVTLPSRLDQLPKRSLPEVFSSLCRTAGDQRSIS